MPGFDRTGPVGQGPRTGRQMGKCRPAAGTDESNATDENPENNPFRGRGPGRGRGKGFGRGRF